MLRLEARPQPSKAMSMASPLLALLVTVLIGLVLFAVLGKDPVRALQMFFWEPIKSAYAWTEIAVKATPLILIGLGLAICYRSNVWNIGAEGQYVIGAVFASGVAMQADGRHAARDRARDPARRHRRRHGVGRHHRAAARPLQRQRDPGQPDAGVRGDDGAELPGVRPVEGSQGLQLPADHHLRRADQGAAPDRWLSPQHRRADRARCGRRWCGCSCFAPIAASRCRWAGSRPRRRVMPASRRARALWTAC